MFEAIKNYLPYNEQEAKDKEIFLYCIGAFQDVLTRSNEVAHITSSAFTVNKTKDKVLMIHHNIYNSWSWVGGHADGEEDLLAVALKELKEETGVKSIRPVSEDVFSLDVLTVFGHRKRGRYVAPHLHLSVAYLIEADERDLLRAKEDENSGVQWIPMEEIKVYSTELHMHKLYEKLISKIRQLPKQAPATGL
ncbi:NUDIX hydrolase [Desulfosporosinus sp. PR]|uniref:NUDIX hydrolase n=1 Tax=Candidatus Desulfosporosinus nitrosoreducens TaxID=3401928 RepID=UPI0027F3CEEA|nr:NUDIX hydrolase [Desulfosporosinus sp. PR]MDQ7095329.1 NUDIX hydrolase [Desulfosporosinus sp. PR]